jgi:NAD(P)-dependent dehydrogenase (short-subunit alcohol dehydrogenase family)
VPSFVQAPLRAQREAGTTQLYLTDVVPQPDRVLGQPCDVTEYAQVQALWDAARAKFGRVDVWINNAGLGHPRIAFWKQAAPVLQATVESNLLGVLYGSHIAAREMLAQGGGQIYNMEGFGSDGRMAEGMMTYGSTKYAVTYFTRNLARDLKGQPVQAGLLSPGIVVTDLILRDYDGLPERWERAQRFFNILGDRVETVTPFLAEKILTNTRNGARIAWLTPAKAAWRFLTAGFIQRDVLQGARPKF